MRGAWAWGAVLGGVLLGDANRGLVLATLVPRVETMEDGLAWRGAAVAAFSAGRLVATPLVGARGGDGDHLGGVLAWSALVALLGNVGYTAASAPWSLTLARFVVGLGASCLGLCRSYVAKHSPPHLRTSAMAGLGAIQYAGFTATSGLALLAPAVHADKAAADSGRSPGRILVALYVLYLIPALAALVADDGEGVAETRLSPRAPLLAADGGSSDGQGDETEGDGEAEAEGEAAAEAEAEVDVAGSFAFQRQEVGGPSSIFLEPAVWRAVGVNVAVRSLLGVLEMLGASVLAASYGDAVEAGEAARRSAWVFWGIGCAGVAMHGAVCLAGKVLSDDGMLAAGLACMTLGHALLALPRGGQASTAAQASALALTWAVGYPFATSSLLAALSREMEGSSSLGAAMSLVAWAGSAARVAAPLVAGLLYDGGEGRAVFCAFAALGLAVTLAVTLAATPGRDGQRVMNARGGIRRPSRHG